MKSENEKKLERDMERSAALDRFSQKLNAIRADKGLSIQSIASSCGFAPAYTSRLFNGKRKPSLDALFKLSEVLNHPFEEIAISLWLTDNSDRDEGYKFIVLLELNNSRKDIINTVLRIDEQELKEKYQEFKSSEFMLYAKRYLKDYVYGEQYQEYQKKKFLRTSMPSVTEKSTEPNTDIISDIVSTLYDMEEHDLLYIRDQIALYIKHFKR